MPILVPQQPPPADYYAATVGGLLGEVQRRSGDLLREPERQLIGAFARLGSDAARLLARLMTRNGVWLREDSLGYREVADVPRALGELRSAGLIERLADAPADALLRLLTRQELDAAFPAVSAPTKREWIARCLSRYPDRLVRARLAERHPWIGVPARRAFDVCCVLFFGGDRQDLTAFILQDLGVHRYERYALDAHTRPFTDRGQLDRYLLCRRLQRHLERLDETPRLAGAILHAAMPAPLSRMEQRARDRLLNGLGRWHERRGELAAARACYARSMGHPARERLARLLHRQGERDALETLLAAMRADPWAPEEEDFAARFPGRRRASRPRVSVCRLHAPAPAIEQHALGLLTGNGGLGWHLENLLPLGLAGLLFWDEVFAPVAGAFSHPLQLGPRDLFWPDFARVRRDRLRRRCQALAPAGALERRLRSVFAAKHGTANALVRWDALPPVLIEALLRHVPHDALRRLACHTIGNLHRCRHGFPDLLVIYGPGVWELVEVKGPNDQLQPAQRVWLRTLEALSLPARVLKLKPAC